MKTKTKTKSKDEIESDTINIDELLICTICGKEFKPNDDTKYIAHGGYTCSWKCFSDYAKGREIEKKKRKDKYKKIKIVKNKYRYIPYVVV